MKRSPFLRRLVNGNRRWGSTAPERFVDRLCYASRPSPYRLDREVLSIGRASENAALRNRWARSHRRRRMRQDRVRITGLHYGPTLPVPSRVKQRFDAWGGA